MLRRLTKLSHTAPIKHYGILVCLSLDPVEPLPLTRHLGLLVVHLPGLGKGGGLVYHCLLLLAGLIDVDSEGDLL